MTRERVSNPGHLVSVAPIFTSALWDTAQACAAIDGWPISLSFFEFFVQLSLPRFTNLVVFPLVWICLVPPRVDSLRGLHCAGGSNGSVSFGNHLYDCRPVKRPALTPVNETAVVLTGLPCAVSIRSRKLSRSRSSSSCWPFLPSGSSGLNEIPAVPFYPAPFVLTWLGYDVRVEAFPTTT